MKVLMFGWEFPPHISGGLGTACHGLTSDLSKLDVNITFVVPKLEKTVSNSPIRLVGASLLMDNDSASKKQSTHLKRFIQINSSLRPYQDVASYEEYIKKIKSGKNEPGSIDYSGNYGDNLLEEIVRYSMVGNRLGEKEDFDVIHAHDWMTFLAAIEAKKASGKPMVVHLHASEFDRSGENPSNDIYNIEKYGLDMADKIIAVSERTKKIIINKYNIDPDKITVIYNAVEKNQLPKYAELETISSTGDKIVLFLGRITMQKGPEYFLEAANIVLKKIKNVRFVMAGSGDMARKMIEKMATMQMADRFHFTGFLRPEERERLFAMSSLYIMPSVSEPFGITPLEAIKHGVPVIVTKQSGIAEILDNVVKVDFWDVEKMASNIIEILNNPELHQEMVERNRRALENIEWRQAALGVKKVYKDMVTRNSRP